MNQKLLSELLRREMKRKGWSIARLASEAGVAYETARRAKHGIGIVSIDTSEKLLHALGQNVSIQAQQDAA